MVPKLQACVHLVKKYQKFSKTSTPLFTYCQIYFCFPEGQLNGVIADLYGAGTETTSSTLLW